MSLTHWSAHATLIIIYALPAIYYVYQGFQFNLGADPVEKLNKALGEIAVIFFILNLYIGVVFSFFRLKGRWVPFLYKQRRRLGVAGFVYLVFHVSFYLLKEESIGHALSEILERDYLMVGSVGAVLLSALAITSNDYFVRKLRPKNWKNLHRTVHVATLFIAIHVILIEKYDPELKWLFFAPLGFFQLVRLMKHYGILKFNKIFSA